MNHIQIALLCSLLAFALADGTAAGAKDNTSTAAAPNVSTESSKLAEIREVHVVPGQGATEVTGTLLRHRMIPISRTGYLYITVRNEDGELIHEQRALVVRTGGQRSHSLRFMAELPIEVRDQDSVLIRHSADAPR